MTDSKGNAYIEDLFHTINQKNDLIALLDPIADAASDLDSFLGLVVGAPGDHNALALISADEVVAHGIRDRLQKLHEVLKPWRASFYPDDTAKTGNDLA